MRNPALFMGLFLALILSFPSMAQSGIIHKEIKADHYFEQYSYHKASELYSNILRKSPNNQRVGLKLARTYYQLSKLDEAETYYSQAIHKKYLIKSLDYLHYAQVLQSVNKFEDAMKWGKMYLGINPRSIIAQNLVYSLENAYQYHQDPIRPIVNEQNINTEAPELSAGFAFLDLRPTKGTLLVVAGMKGSKSYVITENQVIEVINSGTNDDTNWLSDLLEINNVVIGQTVYLNPIYYGLDKSSVDEKYFSELDKLAVLMLKYNFVEFELAAYTDALGPVNYNQTLSQQRANTAMKYLLDQHIPSERLLAVGYGESNPFITYNNNKPGAGQQHGYNRRIEFRLIYMDENQVVSNY